VTVVQSAQPAGRGAGGDGPTATTAYHGESCLMQPQ